MESYKAKLVLNIIRNNIFFESCKILGTIYNFNEILNDQVIIDIPDTVFDKSKEKKIIPFTLITSNEKLSKSLSYKFNIYYGINKAYCFLALINSLQLYELCLYQPATIEYEEGKLPERDYFESDSRTRIILINSPNLIKINEVSFDIKEFKPKVKSIYESENSFEVSLFDVSKTYYASKIIKDKEDFSVIKKIKSYKEKLEKFYFEVKSLNKQKEANVDKYISLTKNLKLEYIKMNFSQKKLVLKNEIQDEQDYKLMYMYLLWLVIGSYYPKKKEEEHISITDLFNLVENIYLEYLNDKELMLHKKIMLIYSHVFFLLTFKNMNEYKKSDLKYVKKKDIKSKSVFGICFKFLSEFIDGITPKSYLFYPFLLLDSGIYEDKDKIPIYGFNMETCEKLKSHLRELLPDVFFIYDKKVESLNKEGGFNFKGCGIVFINRGLALKEFEGNPILTEYKDFNEESLLKHYGMRISKVMMQEIFCHNKFIFDQKYTNDSLCNFYNSKMNLIQISQIYYPDCNDYFKVTLEDGKEESGKFLEYFFGQYNGRLIFDLIYEIKYVGKLIDYVKYFLKEDLGPIKNYIINKYLISQKNIKYDDYNELSLDQETLTMESLINEFHLNSIKEINGKNEEAEKSIDLIKFIEDKKANGEYKGYDYYTKKAMEAKTSKETFIYTRELLKGHLKIT